MAAQPSRRIELLDMFILIAAMAVGAMSIRPWLLYGRVMLDFFTDPSLRATGYVDAIYKCVVPWLASLTVAMVIIRLRRSRLPFYRLARQPGMAACLAASATMAALAIQSALAIALLGVPLDQENFYLKFLMPVFGSASDAVAAVWLIMALGRAWRPERGWVDRSGRVIGVLWIVVFLAMTWDGLWFHVVEIRSMPPMRTPAQEAAAEAIREQSRLKDAQEMEALAQTLKELKQQRQELERQSQDLNPAPPKK